MNILEAMAQYTWLGAMLHELPEEYLQQIRIRRYKPGELIIQRCEDNYYTCIILEGVCCTCQNMENGTRFVLRKATVQDVVGFSAIYQDEPNFEAHISARTPVVAAILPRPLVQKCFGTYHDFSRSISQRVIERLHAMVSLFSECNNYPSYLGLVTYLMHNYLFYARAQTKTESGAIRIMEGRKDIANFLGVDVRSVQRLLGKLKEEGLIGTIARNICITRAQYEAMEQIRLDWFL